MLFLDKIINNIDNSSIVEEIDKMNIDLRDILDENNPNDNDSVGELCNKLSCVTIQMWFNQEELYNIRKMPNDEFKNKYGYSNESLDNLHKLIKRCCDLNYQRSLIMDAIDKSMIGVTNGYSR
jgi:hypothetical protein